MQQKKKKKDRKGNRIRQKTKRQEIAKWNQMTALRFRTGGRHQASPAFGGIHDGMKK